MSQQQEDSVTVSSISNFNHSRTGDDQEQEGRPSLSLSVLSSNQSDADSVVSMPPALTLNLP